MSFRFFKRIKIAPGITVNFSKSGGSFSFGPKGKKITIGSRSPRATIGIPGTGLYYTTTFPKIPKPKRKSLSTKKEKSEKREKDKLSLGFFQRLITPEDEKAFVDGAREIFLGNEKKAFIHLQKASHLADGAFLAGFIAFKNEWFNEAEKYLMTAAAKHKDLGKYFSKYEFTATMELPITDEVNAYIEPNLKGVLLGLVEVYQHKERYFDAISLLEKLKAIDPEDIVINLSLAEFLLDAYPDKKEIYERIIKLSKEVKNETPIHTTLLLYKARALRRLGLLDAANEVIKNALRKKKDRPVELLYALRYEKALIYEEQGKGNLAKKEFEKLYAEAPEYEDVAKRLGLG